MGVHRKRNAVLLSAYCTDGESVSAMVQETYMMTGLHESSLYQLLMTGTPRPRS